MTTQEFSNTFDTLLNSHRDIKDFGKIASNQSIELDEYEKSVLLTQAQDIVVKFYFDRTLNPQSQGFDDSERRQIDFSELITVAKPKLRGYIGNTTTGKLLLETANTLYTFQIVKLTEGNPSVTIVDNIITFTTIWDHDVAGIQEFFTDAGITDITILSIILPVGIQTSMTEPTPIQVDVLKYDDRGIIYSMPNNILFMLNEKIVSGTSTKKTYIVVPINYKEYDRLMSKPFGQPLKKQCWRLFQNSLGVDMSSELIPKLGVTINDYIVRYVRRPRPIVLTDLAAGEYSDNLGIDGVTVTTECELNPIIHMDILNKAVELALSRIGVTSNKE